MNTLCYGKGKISGNFFFESTNLGMLDIFCPRFKIRAPLQEIRFDLDKFDRDSERYFIPMDRNNFWTNKWMQDPKKIVCRL
jgi:hypothetical protein